MIPRQDVLEHILYDLIHSDLTPIVGRLLVFGEKKEEKETKKTKKQKNNFYF